MRASTLFQAGLLFGFAVQLQAATIEVDTTSPLSFTACTAAPADCSFHGAILLARSTPAADTIAFAIPMSDPGCAPVSGVCTITPTGALPDIFGGGAMVIDATTQAGWQANTNTPAQGGLNAQLKIELNGSACACQGPAFSNASSGLRGMVVRGFTTNIVIAAPSVFIEGCYIGTDVTGNNVPSPSNFGINLSGNESSGAGHGGIRIGGTLPAQRNLISGHVAEGLRLLGHSVQVLGNLIGTNAAIGDRAADQ